MIPHGLTLGTILRNLPSCWREHGPIHEIKVAYACGWANLLWSRSAATYHAFKANMESAESRGRGVNAYRRLCRIRNVEPNHALLMGDGRAF